MSNSDDFFSETTLHGLKYVKKSGGTKVLWIIVLIFSLVATVYLTNTTWAEYEESPMRISINATNTPLQFNDFPVLTFCNMNSASRTKLKKMNITWSQVKTNSMAKEVSQSCDDLVAYCLFYDKPCLEAVDQVLTDIGWCCQIDLRKFEVPEMNANDSYVIGEKIGLVTHLDIESFDYGFTETFSEGIMFTADPVGEFPDMLTKSNFLAPGSANSILISIMKTFTTEAASKASSDKRNCLFSQEYDLKYFNSYSQTNCYVDKVISALAEQCGCKGKFIGDNNASSALPDCTAVDSVSWTDIPEYEECMNKGKTHREVLGQTGCPSQCLVNCNDVTVNFEFSSAATPGFMGACNFGFDITSHIACLLSLFGEHIVSRVCPSLQYFEEEPEDMVHLEKRKGYCTDQIRNIWDTCKDILESHERPLKVLKNITSCLHEANLTQEELLGMRNVIQQYARENIVTTYVSFKSRYYTDMKRDVSYTVLGLIANIGGLLGLCLGCSLISIVEILFFAIRKLPFMKPKKTSLNTKNAKSLTFWQSNSKF